MRSFVLFSLHTIFVSSVLGLGISKPCTKSSSTTIAEPSLSFGSSFSASASSVTIEWTTVSTAAEPYASSTTQIVSSASPSSTLAVHSLSASELAASTPSSGSISLPTSLSLLVVASSSSSSSIAIISTPSSESPSVTSSVFASVSSSSERPNPASVLTSTTSVFSSPSAAISSSATLLSLASSTISEVLTASTPAFESSASVSQSSMTSTTSTSDLPPGSLSPPPSTFTTTTSTSAPSSPLISATLPVSPSSSCTPSPPHTVNIPNSDFSDGLENWTEHFSDGIVSHGIYPSAGPSNSPWYRFRLQYIATAFFTSLTQTQIAIPAGSIVECSGFARRDGVQSMRFQMFIDGRPCGAALSPGDGAGWTVFGGRTQEVSGEVHVVEVRAWGALGGARKRKRLIQSPGSSVTVLGMGEVKLVLVSGCGDAVVSASSNTASPTTSQGSPTPLCNAIQNGQFLASSGKLPWSEAHAMRVATRGIVADSRLTPTANQGHGDTSLYQWTANPSSIFSTLALRQTDVYIPTGTLAKCSAWAMVAPSGLASYLSTFSIAIDGVVCAERDAAFADRGGWLEVAGPPVVVRGDVHVVEVYMSTFDGRGMGTLVAIDDVSVMPVGGECLSSSTLTVS